MRHQDNTMIAQISNKSQKSFNDLLEAIDVVNDATENAQTIREFAAGANGALKYLAERMKLSKRQCFILAIFVDNCFDGRVPLSQIAEQMHIRTTKILRYSSDLDKLEERGYIVCCRSRDAFGGGDDIYYRMPMDVLEYFRRNEVYVEPGMGTEKLTPEQLFGQMAILFDRCEKEELSYVMLRTKLELLLNNNSHLNFTKRVSALNLTSDSQVLLLYFCHQLVTESDSEIKGFQIARIFSTSELAAIRRNLTLGHHELQLDNLIEYGCSCGTVDRTEYCLTDKAKRELLSGIDLPASEYKVGLKIHSEIVAKNLFYNNEDETQINDLIGLLTEENYQNIRQRLKDSGLRQGFACLFYGSPGTGKTETVLQLARRTGRNIMQIDISQMRSKWVGESEKNIKGAFDQYRVALSKCKIAPILFFNEADAILNVRQSKAQQAVDKMENTIQNIILEELEQLDGIFIATTNLATNLDSAFERRFLFKIKFHKPTVKVRTKIWKSMFPSVPESNLLALAKEFDFSGGQIENIARHYTIDNILYGGSSFAKLHQFCQNERIEKTRSKKRVGFVQ